MVGLARFARELFQKNRKGALQNLWEPMGNDLVLGYSSQNAIFFIFSYERMITNEKIYAEKTLTFRGHVGHSVTLKLGHEVTFLKITLGEK